MKHFTGKKEKKKKKSPEHDVGIIPSVRAQRGSAAAASLRSLARVHTALHAQYLRRRGGSQITRHTPPGARSKGAISLVRNVNHRACLASLLLLLSSH